MFSSNVLHESLNEQKVITRYGYLRPFSIIQPIPSELIEIDKRIYVELEVPRLSLNNEFWKLPHKSEIWLPDVTEFPTTSFTDVSDDVFIVYVEFFLPIKNYLGFLTYLKHLAP